MKARFTTKQQIEGAIDKALQSHRRFTAKAEKADSDFRDYCRRNEAASTAGVLEDDPDAQELKKTRKMMRSKAAGALNRADKLKAKLATMMTTPIPGVIPDSSVPV